LVYLPGPSAGLDKRYKYRPLSALFLVLVITYLLLSPKGILGQSHGVLSPPSLFQKQEIEQSCSYLGQLTKAQRYVGMCFEPFSKTFISKTIDEQWNVLVLAIFVEYPTSLSRKIPERELHASCVKLFKTPYACTMCAASC
jgi:hypothetical protein